MSVEWKHILKANFDDYVPELVARRERIRRQLQEWWIRVTMEKAQEKNGKRPPAGGQEG